jgi:ABC-type glycerol-3-phosphate transport system permease component
MKNLPETIRMGRCTYAFLSMMALLSLFPFVWMMIGATNTNRDVTKGKITFGSAFFDNYAKLAELYRRRARSSGTRPRSPSSARSSRCCLVDGRLRL